MTKEELNIIKSEFIRLSSNLIRDKSKYANKLILRKHNKAQKELCTIVKLVCSESNVASMFFGDLMNHDDIYVKLVSAEYALSNHVCVDLARDALNTFLSSDNPNIAFEASMAIYVWEHSDTGDG